MVTLEGWVRGFFFFIDRAVYWLLEQAYNIIIELSEVNILRTETISSFANRIYLFLSIIMLFKIAISLINYFINPDSFSDAKNGMGSVLKRVMISLVLVITVPVVFNMAYQLQSIVLKNNILPNIILGEPSNIEYTENVVNKGGQFIAVSIFDAFVRPKSDYNATDAINVDKMPSILDYQSKIKAKQDGEFVYDYKLPLSTIAGGLAAWILVMYCFDIGVRAVKLSFLQLMSPIPIISYIDPKKGDGIFKKWVSACTSAYLMIFIRLIILYFIMFIFAELSYNNWAVFDVLTGDQKTVSGFAYVFVILGLLLFAKEAPQLICDILGIKNMGSFTLNPMKKLGESPYAAGVVGAVGGVAGGLLANGYAAVQHGKDVIASSGNTIAGRVRAGFRGAGSTIAGGASAGFRGAYAGLTSGGKGSALSAATKGITDSSRARNLRAKGYGTWDKVKDRATDIAGVKQSTGTTKMLKDEVNKLKQQYDNVQLREQQIRNQQAYLSNENPNLYSPAQYNYSAEYLRDQDGNFVEETDNLGNKYYKYKYETYSDYMVDHGADSGYLDETHFNMMRQLDRQAQEADREGKKLEKKINDIQDDMGKFKDRNKK